MPSFSVLHCLPEFAESYVHGVSDAIQSSHPLSPLVFLPTIFPSSRVLSNELALCIRWPNCWGFSISLSNEYSGLLPLGLIGLISLQSKELKSLLLHHSSKASVLWHSAFFMVQLSHPYMTAGKIRALTMWTVVSKVMSLFFNTLSSFVKAFLSRSKCPLILRLQSVSAVILEPEKIVVQLLSCVRIFGPMDCSTSGFPVLTISWSLLKLMSVELLMPSNHLILCCSLLLLPSFFPSIRVFSNESALCFRWPRK